MQRQIQGQYSGPASTTCGQWLELLTGVCRPSIRSPSHSAASIPALSPDRLLTLIHFQTYQGAFGMADVGCWQQCAAPSTCCRCSSRRRHVHSEWGTAMCKTHFFLRQQVRMGNMHMGNIWQLATHEESRKIAIAELKLSVLPTRSLPLSAYLQLLPQLSLSC